MEMASSCIKFWKFAVNSAGLSTATTSKRLSLKHHIYVCSTILTHPWQMPTCKHSKTSASPPRALSEHLRLFPRQFFLFEVGGAWRSLSWLLHCKVLYVTIFQEGFSKVPHRIPDHLRRLVHLHILFLPWCSQIRKSFSLVLHLENSAISSSERLQPSPSYFNNKYLVFIKALPSNCPIYFSERELIIWALILYERKHKPR